MNTWSLYLGTDQFLWTKSSSKLTFADDTSHLAVNSFGFVSEKIFELHFWLHKINSTFYSTKHQVSQWFNYVKNSSSYYTKYLHSLHAAYSLSLFLFTLKWQQKKNFPSSCKHCYKNNLWTNFCNIYF